MTTLDEAGVEAAIAASWIPHVYIGIDDGQEHEIPREEVQRRDAEWTAARQASGEDIVIDTVGEHRWQVEQAITAYLDATRPDADVAPGCVSVPIDALCDVLAWVELDATPDDEMRMKLIVLGALVGDAISARTAVQR